MAKFLVIDQPLSKNTPKACPVTFSNGVGCEADLNEKRREKAQHTQKHVSIFPFVFHSKASADGVSRTEPELLQFLVALLLFLFTVPVLAENTILILGDSISSAYGINPQKGWTSLLQQRLQDKKYPYQVINSSISGNTTSDGLNRLPSLLKKYHPQITIIALGGNDGLRGLQLPVIKKNLNAMITLAKQAGSKVLLLGVRLPPNYGQQYTQLFQQMFVELAKKERVPLVALFLNQIDDNPQLMQTDRIHPREEAQILLLNNVWNAVENLLK